MTDTRKENVQIPDVEVKPKRTKRRFTSSYKLAFLDKADACKNTGELGALLRSERLYSSHLTKWRQLKAQGILTHSLKKRISTEKYTPSSAEFKSLQLRNQALEKQLKQAEAIIDIQKKVSEIFGSILAPVQQNETLL